MASSSNHGLLLMGRCSCQGQEKCSTSILYQLLNPGCQCGAAEERALLSLRATSKAASEVLLKTVEFVKNLPSFLALPPQDQDKLLQAGWASLFLLGLAQEKVDFHLASPRKSILLGILTEKQQQQGDPGGQYREKLGKAREFLTQCWSMDISTNEYVYLKGIVLFSPAVPDLLCPHHIHYLQQEAKMTLQEHLSSLHPSAPSRLAQLLLTLDSLQAISARGITELFFQPIIGNTATEAHLRELL
ncbi:nuclear receptor subfamily 0 group B member 2-like [Polyodon spathula]|uniref:nuclear receptor subfamily 0 group B member 2-like n=1 Tax=Polyodon spathula TaxID=7913 RepID=UPI001B7F1E35|nr:nuclear receptor subfamily 0 group B member 2-like [Polyodon spathula]